MTNVAFHLATPQTLQDMSKLMWQCIHWRWDNDGAYTDTMQKVSAKVNSDL